MRAGQTAYLVTFGRAGEDNKSFKLGDVDQTLAGDCAEPLHGMPARWSPDVAIFRSRHRAPAKAHGAQCVFLRLPHACCSTSGSPFREDSQHPPLSAACHLRRRGHATCDCLRATDLCRIAAGFAGADYDLQDALVESTDKKTTTRDADGQQFYDYELYGPVRTRWSVCCSHEEQRAQSTAGAVGDGACAWHVRLMCWRMRRATTTWRQ